MDGTCDNLMETLRKTRIDLHDCVNELCMLCGEYSREHLGACDGCRWKKVRYDTSNGRLKEATQVDS